MKKAFSKGPDTKASAAPTWYPFSEWVFSLEVGHRWVHSSSAGDVFPAGNNKSQSCKIGHINIFGLVCVVGLKWNLPLQTILEFSYFQHYLRWHLPFVIKMSKLLSVLISWLIFLYFGKINLFYFFNVGHIWRFYLHHFCRCTLL